MATTRKTSTKSAVAVPAASVAKGEADALAASIAEQYRDHVHYLMVEWGKKWDQAAAEGKEAIPEHRLKQIHTEAPDQISWWDLRHAEDAEEGGGARLWERIKQAARDELASGLRGAKAVEYAASGRPVWERARYLALRESYRAEWQPQGGIEEDLIEQLAMARTAFESWTQLAIGRVNYAAGRERDDLKHRGEWMRERAGEDRAQDQAAEHAARWNGIFLRTLRALRDKRRYAGLSINADTVNIGGTQHINGAREPEPLTLVQGGAESGD